jgi:hypothetical protein
MRRHAGAGGLQLANVLVLRAHRSELPLGENLSLLQLLKRDSL